MIDPQRLNRLPEEARKRVADFAGKVEGALGGGLRAVIVYGSAAGEEYVPGRSDVNLLVVSERLDLPALRALLDLGKKRGGRPELVPLFLTANDVRSSADVFAVEFQEMQENHVLLLGEDLLSSLTIDPSDVRREVERELKTNVLRMRRAYLEVGRSSRDLESLLHTALSSVLPILRRLLHLKEGKGPRDPMQVLEGVRSSFGVDAAAMRAVLVDRRGTEKIGKRDPEEVFGSFLRELETLGAEADRFLCGE